MPATDSDWCLAEAIDKLRAAITLIEEFGSEARATAADLAEQAYRLLIEPRGL